MKKCLTILPYFICFIYHVFVDIYIYIYIILVSSFLYYADEKLGVEIMFRSLSAPIKQIAKNAGLYSYILIHAYTYLPT